MAEMRVPAWPIPIHHTKFVMAKPQATGIMMPQMPTPLANSSATDHRKKKSSANPTVIPANQNIGVLRVRTTVAIWSVTEPKV